MVHTEQANLLATFSCTELHCTIVVVLKLTEEAEEFREVIAREVDATGNRIGIHTGIFNNVCEFHALSVVGRYIVILHVRLIVLVAILYLDIVRSDEVGVEPFVEIVLLGLRVDDDALVREIVVRAGCQSRCHH